MFDLHIDILGMSCEVEITISHWERETRKGIKAGALLMFVTFHVSTSSRMHRALQTNMAATSPRTTGSLQKDQLCRLFDWLNIDDSMVGSYILYDVVNYNIDNKLMSQIFNVAVMSNMQCIHRKQSA